MKSLLLASLACATIGFSQTTGKLGNAAITENNPAGVSYTANLPSGNGIQGYIEGTSNTNGTGVMFNVNFYQFPDASEGPFLYYVHVNPVPSDGNCDATGGYLDPYERSESPVCNASQPETCQVGDLSGKHGSMSPPAGSSFQTLYLDLYLSTEPGVNSFFGNRSIVIHAHNLTSLACANFELAPGSPTPSPVSGGGASSTSATGTASSSAAATGSAAASSTATESSTASGTAASASASHAGGAVGKIVSGSAMLAGLAGVMALAL